MGRNVLAGIIAAVVIGASSPASATEWIVGQGTQGAVRAHQLDVGTQIGAGSRFVLVPGLLYGYPLVHDGFIPSLNDSFYLEGGGFFAAFFGSPSYFAVVPQIGVRWNFYLTRSWTVFAAIRSGLAYQFGDAAFDGAFFYGSGTVGAHWHFSESMALRLETGADYAGYSALVMLSFQL